MGARLSLLSTASRRGQGEHDERFPSRKENLCMLQVREVRVRRMPLLQVQGVRLRWQVTGDPIDRKGHLRVARSVFSVGVHRIDAGNATEEARVRWLQKTNPSTEMGHKEWPGDARKHALERPFA